MAWIWAMILALMPVMTLAQTLSPALAAKVERDPQGYLDDLAVLIDGYGAGGAIDLQGLQNVVAMTRADGRALAYRRLHGADLNGDGTIGGDEMRLKAAALAAAARGRLVLYFGKADANGDDLVDAAELRGYADRVALSLFSSPRADAVLAVMEFDQDRDGRVTLAEARAMVSRLAVDKAKGAVATEKQI